jgi:uncharacterized protein
MILTDYSISTLFALAFFAFLAGFIDAVAGGGGLIQLPAMLVNLPNTLLPTIFGTNKIAALSGTSIAAYRYGKRIKFSYPLLLIISFWSFVASFLGAKTVSFMNPNILKPIVLVTLIAIAIYTFLNKNLGSVETRHLSLRKQMIYGSLFGFLIGFYDGFFGPGTGSLLLLGFVMILGFEFLQASAYSKIINCITNFSALIVFISHGNFIPVIAIIMAVFNIIGNYLGSHMALKRGNSFIRVIFLIVVTLLIIRYGYDVFMTFKF